MRNCPKCGKEYCASHDVHSCDDPSPVPDDPDEYTPPDPGDFEVYTFQFIKILENKFRVTIPSSYEPYRFNQIILIKGSSSDVCNKALYDYGLASAVNVIFNMGYADGVNSFGIADFCRTASIVLMSIVFIVLIVKGVKKNS